MEHTITNRQITNAPDALEHGLGSGIPAPRLHKNGSAVVSVEKIFQQVERAKQEWESAVDSLTELICVVDRQGRIIRANRTVEAWQLGHVVSIQDHLLHELLHPDCPNQQCDLESFISDALYKAHFNQASQIELEDSVLGRQLLVNVRPVFTKGALTQRTATIVLQDITERKVMEKALDIYNSRLQVINRVGKAILAANSPQDIAEAAVSHLKKLLPFQRAKVTLRNIENDELLVIDILSNAAVHRRPDRWLSKKATGNLKIRRLDRFYYLKDLSRAEDLCEVEEELVGEGIRTYLNIPLVAESEFIGSFGLGAEKIDSFQPEHIDTAIEVAHLLSIATYQAELYRKLEESNSRLEQAIQAKNEMVQNVSHELKNPLAIAEGYTYLMKDEAFGPMTDDQGKALDILDDQLEKLDFMLSRLLILQSLEKEALQFKTVSMESIIQSLVDGWQIRTSNAGIAVDTILDPELPLIKADPDLLSQALANLMDNGIKFSSDGGSICIRTWMEKENLLVSVSDQGAGITQEELEMIFQRFYQADGSTTRSSGGMGIGLALVHEIIDAHGGRVWAESEGKGCGSTFYISIPVDSRYRV